MDLRSGLLLGIFTLLLLDIVRTEECMYVAISTGIGEDCSLSNCERELRIYELDYIEGELEYVDGVIDEDVTSHEDFIVSLGVIQNIGVEDILILNSYGGTTFSYRQSDDNKVKLEESPECINVAVVKKNVLYTAIPFVCITIEMKAKMCFADFSSDVLDVDCLDSELELPNPITEYDRISLAELADDTYLLSAGNSIWHLDYEAENITLDVNSEQLPQSDYQMVTQDFGGGSLETILCGYHENNALPNPVFVRDEDGNYTSIYDDDYDCIDIDVSPLLGTVYIVDEKGEVTILGEGPLNIEGSKFDVADNIRIAVADCPNLENLDPPSTFKLQYTTDEEYTDPLEQAQNMKQDITNFLSSSISVPNFDDAVHLGTPILVQKMIMPSVKRMDSFEYEFELPVELLLDDPPDDVPRKIDSFLCCQFSIDSKFAEDFKEKYDIEEIQDCQPEITASDPCPSVDMPQPIQGAPSIAATVGPTISPTESSAIVNGNDSGNNTLLIAIGAIVGLLFVCVAVVVIALVFYFYKNNKKSGKNKEKGVVTDKQSEEMVEKPSQNDVNDKYEEAIFAASVHNSNAEIQARPNTIYAPVAAEDSSLEKKRKDVGDNWLIEYDELKIGKKLGSGSYGLVRKGTWRFNEVAIKFCSDVAAADSFIAEAKLMVELRPHNNVVQVFGVSIKDDIMYLLIMEFMAGGSLDVLLYESPKEKKLKLSQKKKIIQGVAKGLLHLHKEGIIHRDMAARNVLLDESGTPKISDFGMSRLLGTDNDADVGKTKSSIGPIKWMAPENMRKKYSTKSDVWAFACFLYEVFHEKEPWAEDNDLLQLAVQIRDKAVTPKVDENVTPDEYHELMKQCWNADPKDRPSMESICEDLIF